MRLSERRKEGVFYFVVRQSEGAVMGGEVKIAVYADREGEGDLRLRRTLYFDEQSPEHIANFCREFAYDEHYRKLCLDGTAHWWTVARLYETNARIIRDEQTVSPDDTVTRGRELFHFIRRDLARITGRPEYQAEMARIGRGAEDDLREALALLARVKNLKVVTACQGCARLQVAERLVYLPSCHALRATVALNPFPPPLKNYLRSGLLGQQHLARFAVNGLSAAAACYNKRFIRIFTAALHGFLRKTGAAGPR